MQEVRVGVTINETNVHATQPTQPAGRQPIQKWQSILQLEKTNKESQRTKKPHSFKPQYFNLLNIKYKI